MTDQDKLLLQAARGDQAAFGELLRAFRPTLYDIAKRKTGTRNRLEIEPEDVVQRALARASENFRHVCENLSDAEALKAWLSTVLDREFKDFVKERKAIKRGGQKRRIEPSPDAGPLSAFVLLAGVTTTTPSRKAVRREDAEFLSAALDHVPAGSREVLELIEVKRVPLRQAAERLRITVGDLRRQHRDAVEDFRRAYIELKSQRSQPQSTAAKN